MRARVESWDILENNLTIFVGVNTTNQTSSCLWNRRDDTDFITNSCIDKAGFTRAWSAEEGDISDMSRGGGSHNKKYKIQNTKYKNIRCRGAYITIKSQNTRRYICYFPPCIFFEFLYYESDREHTSYKKSRNMQEIQKKTDMNR